MDLTKIAATDDPPSISPGNDDDDDGGERSDVANASLPWVDEFIAKAIKSTAGNAVVVDVVDCDKKPSDPKVRPKRFARSSRTPRSEIIIGRIPLPRKRCRIPLSFLTLPCKEHSRDGRIDATIAMIKGWETAEDTSPPHANNAPLSNSSESSPMDEQMILTRLLEERIRRSTLSDTLNN